LSVLSVVLTLRTTPEGIRLFCEAEIELGRAEEVGLDLRSNKVRYNTAEKKLCLMKPTPALPSTPMAVR